eukprot:1064613-Pyramimonas_sp.AAC.1
MGDAIHATKSVYPQEDSVILLMHDTPPRAGLGDKRDQERYVHEWILLSDRNPSERGKASGALDI